MKNENLISIVKKENSKLQEVIVDYVGNYLNPDSEEITTEQVIEVFAQEFPEFLLAVAEENWISGYTQALKDVEFHGASKKNNEKLHQKQA
jgi:hypothetical protein